jgi:LPXTG-site transpeptidase (sortase) family protein
MGTIYLAPARTAWLRQNELRETSQPILLLDVGAWHQERLENAELWSNAVTSTQLAQHPLTRLKPLQITIELELNTAWIDGVGEAAARLIPSRTLIAQTSHVLSQVSLSFAVALLLLFAGPVVVINTQDLVSQALESRKPVALSPEPLSSPTPPSTQGITSDEDVFSIEIPELKIKSNVSANIDPSDEKSYSSALKKGIAHAAGTGLPGQLETNKTIYLFAHSTDAPWNIARYNAQFYGLKDAKEGQEIRLRFWGEDKLYRITRTEIVPASDTTYLMPQTDTEQLILQTCYPPGTAWKRLIVVAKPIS